MNYLSPFFLWFVGFLGTEKERVVSDISICHGSKPARGIIFTFSFLN